MQAVSPPHKWSDRGRSQGAHSLALQNGMEPSVRVRAFTVSAFSPLQRRWLIESLGCALLTAAQPLRRADPFVVTLACRFPVVASQRY